MDLLTLIEEREEARAKKDWDKADKIRDRLRTNGVQTNTVDSLQTNTICRVR